MKKPRLQHALLALSLVATLAGSGWAQGEEEEPIMPSRLAPSFSEPGFLADRSTLAGRLKFQKWQRQFPDSNEWLRANPGLEQSLRARMGGLTGKSEEPKPKPKDLAGLKVRGGLDRRGLAGKSEEPKPKPKDLAGLKLHGGLDRRGLAGKSEEPKPKPKDLAGLKLHGGLDRRGLAGKSEEPKPKPKDLAGLKLHGGLDRSGLAGKSEEPKPKPKDFRALDGLNRNLGGMGDRGAKIQPGRGAGPGGRPAGPGMSRTVIGGLQHKSDEPKPKPKDANGILIGLNRSRGGPGQGATPGARPGGPGMDASMNRRGMAAQDGKLPGKIGPKGNLGNRGMQNMQNMQRPVR